MILNIKLLPDGSGRTLIHWLNQDDEGPIQTKGHAKYKGIFPGIRGRIACNPKQNSVNPVDRNGEHLMCMYSEEVRAATCPKCLATEEAKAILAKYENTMELSGHQIPLPTQEREQVATMTRK